MPKNQPKISCVIINYNGAKFIKTCLNSLLEQNYSNIEIFFIDNVSTDNSVDIMKKEFPEKKTGIKLIENTKNTGYTGGANQAVELGSKSDYLMLLNPDIIYEKDFISKLVDKMEEDKKIGAIGGKYLKYDFDKKAKTKTFDSTGLYCYKNRRVVDRGQGIEDIGQYDKAEEIFGISGASPMYRVEALKSAAIPLGNGKKEIFDEDFFMYKEDIDISWRLWLLGWKCYYYPKALAYHGRGTGVLKRANHLEVLKHRQKVSKLARYHSYKNQRLMQIKNELWPSFIRNFLPFIIKEILALGYITLKEPYVLKSAWELILMTPQALRKRTWIMKHKKISWQKMHYFLGKKSL